MNPSLFGLKHEFGALALSDVKETGKELGRGSYGEVKEAYWLGTPCAIKRVHPLLVPQSGAVEDNKVSRDFVQECRAWKDLRHPHIVQLLGVIFEQASPLPVLVMERLSTSLRRFLDNKEDFPLNRKVSVLYQVALGLVYLHSQKQIHRDFSTNNILLETDSWKAKITDFGVSRVLDSTKSRMTGTLVPGTQAFMPPEMFEIPAEFSDKVDVFSFGCVIISTLTHQWPEPGPAKRRVGGKLVALTEYQRREHFFAHLTPQEKELFLRLTEWCLQEDPFSRPCSRDVVENLVRITTKVEKLTRGGIPSELQKANARVLEAEKGKADAEAAKVILEARVRAADKALHEEKLHKRLLQIEAQSCKDKAKEIQERIEAEKAHLSEQLAELCMKEEAARLEMQEMEGERTALKAKVASLEAEVVRGQEHVSSLEQQLSRVRGQQQMVVDIPKAETIHRFKEFTKIDYGAENDLESLSDYIVIDSQVYREMKEKARKEYEQQKAKRGKAEDIDRMKEQWERQYEEERIKSGITERGALQRKNEIEAKRQELKDSGEFFMHWLKEATKIGYEREEVEFAVRHYDEYEGKYKTPLDFLHSEWHERTLEDAERFMNQKCPVCMDEFLMDEMVAMLHCECFVCKECFNEHYTMMAHEKSISQLNCLVCAQPDLADTDIDKDDYLMQFAGLLKEHVSSEHYQLFQKKIMEFALQKDPNFLWCAHTECGNGFIHDPPLNKVITCPYCQNKMCFDCKKPWEGQHKGISCKDFARWRAENDKENQQRGLAAFLNEIGCECPKCHCRYSLTRGNCLHFRCVMCPTDICGGCGAVYDKYCRKYKSCANAGSHAHHPRHCLFYLRDWPVKRLQKMLTDKKIKFDTEAPEAQWSAVYAMGGYKGQLEMKCRIMLQKEMGTERVEEECGDYCKQGRGGLCEKHYKEYLVFKINEASIDPADEMDVDELKAVILREGKPVPARRGMAVPHKERLKEQVKMNFPLANILGIFN